MTPDPAFDVSGSNVEVLAIALKSESESWLAQFGSLLREAETRDVVITRHGKPAGVLIGFKSEDDWFDYRLENDQRFLERIKHSTPHTDARASVVQREVGCARAANR